MTHERCDQCGFDGAAYDHDALVEAVRALGPRWRALLDAAGAELRVRPAPGVWSAIEYASHSSDITALHAFGVEQALTGTEPGFPDIAADEMIEAAAADYIERHPLAVADAMERESSRLAQAAAAVPPGDWDLAITVGTERLTVRRLLEHALHDSLHHVDDVERGLRGLRVT